VSTVKEVMIFDIFDNAILKQALLTNINSIAVIEDSRVLNRDLEKYLLASSSSRIMVGKISDMTF